MILGIAGSHGAGKGAVVGILKEYGFVHCSAREIFLRELERRGVEANRPSLSDLANELRATYGVSYVVDTYLKKHNPVIEDIVIESIYTLGEAEAIRIAGGYMLSVDADPHLRYQRIRNRRSETDAVSEEEFVRRQEEESHSDDPIKQHARTVMEQADFHIENNGDLEELRIQVTSILERIAKEEEESQ